MAKTPTAVAPETNPPRVMLDLEPEHIKVLKDVKPGTMVQVILVMRVTSISMREPYGDSEKKYVGSLDGEIDEMKIEKHSKNFFAQLAKNDVDGT
jgi:hypothetical protein